MLGVFTIRHVLSDSNREPNYEISTGNISLHPGSTRRARVFIKQTFLILQVQDVGLNRFGKRRVFICVDRLVVITSLHFCHIIREIFGSVEVQTAQEVMVSKHFLITLKCRQPGGKYWITACSWELIASDTILDYNI